MSQPHKVGSSFVADLPNQLGYSPLSIEGRTLQSIKGRYRRRTSGFTITAHDWTFPATLNWSAPTT